GTLLPCVGPKKLETMKLLKKEKYGEESHKKRFGTEEQCRDYLVHLRWNGRPRCQKIDCGNQHMNYYISTRRIWKCSVCKKQFRVTTGTIFEHSKLPLTKWFKAIFYFTTHKRGVSSCQLAKWLEVEQRTAWFMLHRLRAAINDENKFDFELLEGEVEADETSIGPVITMDERLKRAKKRHYEEQDRIHGMSVGRKRTKRGYSLPPGVNEGKPRTRKEFAEHKKKYGERIPFEQHYVVFGMQERGGKLVLKLLGKSDKAKLQKPISKHMREYIGSSSVVFTDQSALYNDVPDFFAEHHKVNHKKKEFVRGKAHTQNIDNAWKHFKKTIDGTYFHMRYHHFETYLDEYTYRWNRKRNSLREIFDSFITRIFGNRLKWDELISKKVA
ncbi:IS1595 family transposase, partial [Crocinitomix catalasitica]|nr:IS1595 family transposase [Crocinitomix catalasitica]